MPAHFSIDLEKRLVSVSFDHQVSVRDVVQYLQALKAGSGFNPDFSELVDLTQVVSSEVDFQAAMMLARDVDPFSPWARRAFVAPRAATYGVVRMYQLVRADAENIAVFRTLEDAKRWVETSEPVPEGAGIGEQVVRCPYCIMGDHLRPMLPKTEGWYICAKCGHTVMPENPDYRCRCEKCEDQNRAA